MSTTQMQAFEFEANDEPQHAARDGSRARSDVTYRSKPFTDLVDEDKHVLVRRRICSTIFGGYRTAMEKEREDSALSVGLHLGQILIYLIMPGTVILATTIFKSEEQRVACVIVAAVLPGILNAGLMLSSYSRRHAEPPEDADSISCGSQAGFLFLFPPKQSSMEMVLCFMLTLAYGAMMAYAFHPYTMSLFYGSEQSLASSMPWLVLVGLSSYSLFSHHCPESAIYRDNDQELGWGSNHYQRVVFYVLLGLALLVYESFGLDEIAGKTNEPILPGQVGLSSIGVSGTPKALYQAFIVVYVLQVIGILSHPVVNILWALEQFSIHVLGTSPRASDGRIVLSFCVNLVFVAICYQVRESAGHQAFMASVVFLSYVASHNVLGNLAVKTPSQGVNERLKSQRAYADIVFASKEQAEKVNGQSSSGNSSLSMVISIFVCVALTITAYLASAGTTEAPEEGEDKTMNTVLYVISLVLLMFAWISSAGSRFAVCRVIPCPQRAAGRGTAIASRVIQIAVMVCLTLLYLKISFIENPNKGLSTKSKKDLTEEVFTFYTALTILAIYRAFNKLFHNPLAAVIESAACLVWGTPEALMVAAFALSRLYIFVRKLIYVVVSVVTAMKNKKQRFSGQNLCFALQFTVFLPLTLGVILLTALLDTATIPFLGFAFFIIGYPKPLRGWSSINPIEVNPNDSRSDGHLYQAMLSQLSVELQNLVGTDPFHFGCGSFYFMKNEKMIILLQVLERGNNYIMVTVKGTELQETTVCHAEENERINEITEEIFDAKARQPRSGGGNENRTLMHPHPAFSLSALKQINFGVYDDQKVSMSGVIENPEFEQLVKKAYAKIVMLKLCEHFQNKPQARLLPIYSSELSAKELQSSQPYHDRAWATHLQFDHSRVGFSSNAHSTSEVVAARSPSQASKTVPMAGQDVRGSQNFKNQVSPAGAGQAQPRQPPVSFLDRIDADNHARDNGPAGRRDGARQSLEGDKRSQGVAASPISQSVVPAVVLSVPKRPVKESPAAKKAEPAKRLDDLDELEDMLDNLEGGSEDDLDDLLDDFEAELPQAKKQNTQNKPTRDYKLPAIEQINARPEAGDLHLQEDVGSQGARTRADPSASSGVAADALQAERRADWDTDQIKRKHSPLHQRARTPSSSHGQKRQKNQTSTVSDVDQFTFQSFTLLFGDEFQTMPSTLIGIFHGDWQKNFNNRDFLASSDTDALHLKYIILQSARLAFHYALEAFIMGEVDLPDFKTLEDEVKAYDREWFLGSEEYLWNAAIERSLPNLERLIQKKDGQYFAHRLKFGQSKESTFSIFEFRREVIRGIWANLNMELLYYTNANDERFSIQAEKDILRNLLVQLAEVPLGYPVFNSGARSISF